MVVMLGAAACESPYGTLDPAGSEAHTLARIGWFLIGFVLFVVVAMGVLLLLGAMRSRGSLEEHLPVDAGGGKRWVLMGGVVLPVVVAVGLFLLTVTTLRGLPSDSEPVDVELEVTAHQWWWEVSYQDPQLPQRFRTANEIHIPVGARVGIDLKSQDVIHSFWVPRLHGKLDLIPGHTNRIVLQADEPGIYQGECAEYCGVQHAHMRFLVVAESPAEYQAWAARQREPARTPSNAQLARGQQAFEEYACAMCHQIRGTRARGSVAPDLTHVGSRLTLAAGTLPNTRARLQAWIVNAQSLKPGARMPTLEQFDGETLNALAAYLESLE
jgi:cytochrome c oxidase subunit 2